MVIFFFVTSFGSDHWRRGVFLTVHLRLHHLWWWVESSRYVKASPSAGGEGLEDTPVPSDPPSSSLFPALHTTLLLHILLSSYRSITSSFLTFLYFLCPCDTFLASRLVPMAIWFCVSIKPLCFLPHIPPAVHLP